MPDDSPLLLLNPARRHDTTATRPRSPAGAPIAFHRRLPGYAPTRVVDAPALAVDIGVSSLAIKDEAGRLGMPSFKILGASWAVYRLLLRKLGHEPTWTDLDELRAAFAPLGTLALVAATDGNHGRAVAHMARLLGYDAHILVPAGTVAARIDGIANEGATVTVVDGTYDDAVRASAELAGDRRLVVSDTSWEGYTEVPADVIDGYTTIFAELDEQLAAAPDLVVVPMGVGALTAAAVAHYASIATVVAVEPLSAACGLRSAEAGRPVFVPGPHDSIMAGLNCGTVSPVAWPSVSAGVDAFVAVSDEAAEQAMRDLASVGVVAGETGAASLAGLRAVAAANVIPTRAARALVLCTEGATDPSAYERIVGHAS